MDDLNRIERLSIAESVHPTERTLDESPCNSLPMALTRPLLG